MTSLETTPPIFAVSLTVPAFLAVTTPSAETEAIELSEETYSISPVTSAGATSAESCAVSPILRLVLSEVKVIVFAFTVYEVDAGVSPEAGV